MKPSLSVTIREKEGELPDVIAVAMGSDSARPLFNRVTSGLLQAHSGSPPKGDKVLKVVVDIMYRWYPLCSWEVRYINLRGEGMVNTYGPFVEEGENQPTRVSRFARSGVVEDDD